MATKKQTTTPQQKTAWQLADDITGITLTTKPLITILFEQLEEISGTEGCGKLYSLVGCVERYLDDIHKLCGEAQKDGGGVGTLGQKEVASMLAAFGQMSESHQTSIYGTIHDMAAKKLDGRTA